MTEDQAEIVALQALEWLASDPELLDIFLTSAGVRRDEVNARAAEAEFLAGVLDFVLQADSHVTAFAAAAGIDPTVPIRARHGLPGGAPMDWT